MGKAEEYLAKKRNKAARKRLSNTVDFTRGVQAAKRRRKAGRRRICEGMCYSLPTPEDPFNDLYKEKFARKQVKKVQEREGSGILKGTKASSRVEMGKKDVRAKKSKANGRSLMSESKKIEQPSAVNEFIIEQGYSKYALSNSQLHALSGSAVKVKWKPSCDKCLKTNNSWTCVGGDAFEAALCALLNANMLRNEDHDDGAGVEQRMPSEECNKWDWMFWEACGTGSDVLATGRVAGMFTQVSNVLAAVGHIGLRRQNQIPIKHPIVLFLVQSKEQTLQVRNIFKLLKTLLGTHAVGLHTETALEHQIEGLRSTASEVLVATPDRLNELLSVDAVSLSNISFMVVDGLEEIVSHGLSDYLLHIKVRVPNNVQTVLSSGAFPPSTYRICQKLLKEPIHRVTSNTSMPQCGACISQNVHVLVSEDKRKQKLKKILRDHIESREDGITSGGGLLVLFQHHQSLLHARDMIQEEGYSVDALCDDYVNKVNQSACHTIEQFRNGQVEVLLATEDCVSQIDLASVVVVVLYEFTTSMEFYRQTLTMMARYTANGVLYSFCSGVTAPFSSQLIDVLKECQQPIPLPLRMLADAAQVVEERKG